MDVMLRFVIQLCEGPTGPPHMNTSVDTVHQARSCSLLSITHCRKNVAFLLAIIVTFKLLLLLLLLIFNEYLENLEKVERHHVERDRKISRLTRKELMIDSSLLQFPSMLTDARHCEPSLSSNQRLTSCCT